MKITTAEDETVRTIRLKVQDGEILTDVLATRKPQFRPDRIIIKVTESTRDTQVHVSGPIILKSGELSRSVRGAAYWYGRAKLEERMPPWLYSVVCEAIGGGVTEWTK